MRYNELFENSDDDMFGEPGTVAKRAKTGIKRAGARQRSDNAATVKTLAHEFFGGAPYSSGNISGGKIYRMSFPCNRELEGHYRARQEISPADKAKLLALKDRFLKFIASKGADASKVDVKFHVGSGVYASVRVDRELAEDADDDELFGTRLSASLAQRFDFPEDGDLGYTLGGGGVEYGNGHQTEGLVIVSRESSSIAFIPDFTYFDDEPSQEDLEFLFYDDDTERTPLTRHNIDKFMSLEEQADDEELFGKSKPGFIDFETADKLARTLRKFLAVFIADPEMIEFKQEKPQQYAKVLNDFVIAYNYLKIGNAYGAIAAIEREPMGYDLDEWAFNYIEKLSHIDLRNIADRDDDDTYDAMQKAARELPPSTATLDESDDDMFGAKPTGRYWHNTPEEFQQYWNTLIPSEGPAKTVQGELLRAANKIYYDYYNNGFGNNWSGAMKFIHQHLGHAPGLATLAPFSAGRMPRGAAQEKQIEIALDQMMDTVMATVRRANGQYQPNSTDMYSLNDKREYDDEEDVYDYDDDEDDDEDYR